MEVLGIATEIRMQLLGQATIRGLDLVNCGHWRDTEGDVPRIVTAFGQGFEPGERRVDHVLGAPPLQTAQGLNGELDRVEVVLQAYPLVAGNAALIAPQGEVGSDAGVIDATLAGGYVTTPG